MPQAAFLQQRPLVAKILPTLLRIMGETIPIPAPTNRQIASTA
ncbi:hypothetical protein SAMN05421539_102644 [Jannaschia seohaensis]|uniref:Uncharacterized protein n=1 Tax=Jannaschia seohaensis TaxID=475081 RepID=A0A2Y9AHZ8_9RHOB|nr:hypothetical protein BCF38_102644 [Jannaschia seohaensis]SSA41997.1 hypothetical protein SAMN05421539_102644 [Jannaschia seohaensis]